MFTVALVLFFLVISLGATSMPARFDGWLDDVGQCVAKPFPILEKLVTINPDVDAGIWLTGGAMALVGWALMAWVLRGLGWRLLMAVLVTMATWYLYQHTPPNEWFDTVTATERLLFFAPGLLLVWLAIPDGFEAKLTPARDTEIPDSIRGRRALEIRLRYRYIWQPGEFGTVVTAVGLFLLAGLVFIPGNYLLDDQVMDRAVLCVDLKSGNILWETIVWTDKTERKHSDNSYATPTCAADGRHVLAFFGGHLTCLDYEGTVLWQHQDPDYIRNTKYGSSSSPIIVDNMGIVLQGKEDKSRRSAWLAAFNMTTGRQRWRIEPPDIGEGYTTPLVHRSAAGTQLLIPSEKRVNSYRVGDGIRLWTQDSPVDQIVASLAKTGNILVIGGGTWGPKAVLALELSEPPPTPAALALASQAGRPGVQYARDC